MDISVTITFFLSSYSYKIILFIYLFFLQKKMQVLPNLINHSLFYQEGQLDQDLPNDSLPNNSVRIISS